MTLPVTPPKKRRLSARSRKLLATATCALTGAGLGYACQFLPPTHQALCHLAAKIIAFFGGG